MSGNRASSMFNRGGRVRHDRIDGRARGHAAVTAGFVTSRSGLGAGTRVLMLVADLDVRIVSEDGELLRELTIDPNRIIRRSRKLVGRSRALQWPNRQEFKWI